MLDGSRTPRTRVASSRTAKARPTPICLNIMNERLPKRANTPTMTMAALVTVPAVILIACDTATSVSSPCRRAP